MAHQSDVMLKGCILAPNNYFKKKFFFSKILVAKPLQKYITCPYTIKAHVINSTWNLQNGQFCRVAPELCIHSMLRVVLKCLLVARRENLTGVSTDLTGQLKNHDQTGAGRPDQFPSLRRIVT